MFLEAFFIGALLLLGEFLTRRIKFLRSLNIPGSFVGGIFGSLILMFANSQFNFQISSTSEIRDFFLILFFICGALEITVSQWRIGGSRILGLSVVCLLLIVLQNMIGLLSAKLTGRHPAIGLMSGSIAYVGGMGSVVAWGEEVAARGVPGGTEIGILSASLGLILSTLIAGPYIALIIKSGDVLGDSPANSVIPPPIASSSGALGAALTLCCVCVAFILGDQLCSLLAESGIVFPKFLSAMIVALLLSIIADIARVPLDRPAALKIGGFCVQIFLVMTLSSIDLWSLKGALGYVAASAVIQTFSTLIFVHLFVYRLFGRTYESLAIAGGFLGFALGSFAVATATLNQIQENYRPVPNAKALVTLVGGGIVNLMNALLILTFLRLVF